MYFNSYNKSAADDFENNWQKKKWKLYVIEKNHTKKTELNII